MNEQGRSVRRMFASVAPRYDLLNHLLSLNLDRLWRHRLARWAGETARAGGGGSPLRILDAGAGTGDLSLALARQFPQAQIAALDFVEPMLERLKRKTEAKSKGNRIAAVCGDALQLPFADRTFEVVASAFGLRNLSPVADALREMARVLRPGGLLLILDFALPKRGLWAAVYRLYFFRVLPKIGRWISRTSAYTYLPASVALFPEPHQLADLMGREGFLDIQWRSMAGGAVAIHRGIRGHTGA
ncbi:MAG: ubiquinone/menaquinone biosynthesis methyltransferase [Candidatus Sumerlaeia bacterium]|nr:ubiquinone/menaquinone biosynthesis methyltransferase [Candidatus Sumerlaeia bacterium]